MGDCQLPSNISRRKKENSIFTTKLERMKKEFLNLKKAHAEVKGSDDKLAKMFKELEFKLKILDTEKNELGKHLIELERIPTADFDDL